MSRHQQIISTNRGVDAMSAAVKQLESNGYFFEQGESHWRKGQGLLVAPQFVKLSVVPEGIELQAWLKFAWLPGVYAGEFDLEGAFMIIPKRQLRAMVKKVEEAITAAPGT